jgi:hypothetical protein
MRCGRKAAPAARANQGGSRDSEDAGLRAATAGTAEGGGTAMRCGRKATPAAQANQGGCHDSEDAEAKSRHGMHS